MKDKIQPMNPSVFKEVDDYIASLLATEDQSLLETTSLIKKENLPDQSISPVQGKLLQVLAKSCSAKRILELGTFGGYSTIWLANMLPPEGKLITIEFDKKHADIAQRNIEGAHLSHIVDLKVGKAMDILEEMIVRDIEPFDFIFMDADKPPYLEYFKIVLKLTRKGSMIVCDNVIRNGKVLEENSSDEKVIGVQRLNTYLQNCKEVSTIILQTVGAKEYDGMVLAVVN